MAEMRVAPLEELLPDAQATEETRVARGSNPQMQERRYSGSRLERLKSSSFQTSFMRRRRSSQNENLGTGCETAVTMQFEMWVMPVSKFVGLSELVSHEKLREEDGMLVKWNPSMTHVFYVSHQWTSNTHPDHTAHQLRAFQAVLLRMLRGDLPETAPVDSGHLKISTAEWQQIVRRNCYIWLDFCSLPQKREAANDNAQKLASHSISAYIERCSHFFACTPSVAHHEGGFTCNYGTWLQSSGCRVELCSLLFSRYNHAPAVVIVGGDATPFMISPTSVISRIPGTGVFSCCTRKHIKTLPDGTRTALKCRKETISPMMITMLQERRSHHLSLNEVVKYRQW